MDKKTALIIWGAMSIVYILMVWVVNYFGPGATFFFTVLYFLFTLFLLNGIFSKKKKK